MKFDKKNIFIVECSSVDGIIRNGEKVKLILNRPKRVRFM